MQAHAFWRKLDGPGHDAARVESRVEGLRLMGHAAFADQGQAVGLTYVVEMAPDGTALSGRVRGFANGAVIDQTIQRADGDWLLNGRPQGLKGLLDLDFGFTPATNWQQLRRLGLETGERVEVDVAWLDVGALRLEALPQIYRRVGEFAYAYEAPTFDYRAELAIAPSGFVADYPGLWRLEEA